MNLSPKSPDDILAAILNMVRKADILPSAAKIDLAPGALTESWVAKASLPHGGALLGLTGMRLVEHESEGTPCYELSLGFYFFPKAATSINAADSLANQAFKFITLIDRNRWGLENANWPTGLNARNAFSPTLAARQSGLWLIDWRQKFFFSEQPDAPDFVRQVLFG